MNLLEEETHDLSEVGRFLFKSFHIRGLQKHCFVPHTNSYIVMVTQQSVDDHILSLGRL